jgi:ribosome-associated toxin RatA of RatAB toxin-antitoxin module
VADISDSIVITAPPERVFDLVSDLAQMGRFSPENTGGQWLSGATGPAVGARLKGSNAQGRVTWSTVATVVDFNRPRTFAFEVVVSRFKVARWEYQIESREGGCTVTESWTDRRGPLAKRLTRAIVADRESFTRHSIRTTLEGVKKAAEAT